jgi:hypothetical protein
VVLNFLAHWRVLWAMPVSNSFLARRRFDFSQQLLQLGLRK